MNYKEKKKHLENKDPFKNRYHSGSNAEKNNISGNKRKEERKKML